MSPHSNDLENFRLFNTIGSIIIKMRVGVGRNY